MSAKRSQLQSFAASGSSDPAMPFTIFVLRSPLMFTASALALSLSPMSVNHYRRQCRNADLFNSLCKLPSVTHTNLHKSAICLGLPTTFIQARWPGFPSMVVESQLVTCRPFSSSLFFPAFSLTCIWH